MMAPIYLKKYETKNSTIYYHVEAPINCQDFYIGIDISNKTLAFFKSNIFDNPIKVLDLSGSDVVFVAIDGFDRSVTNFVTARAFSAILKKEFPENINYNLH